MLWSKGQMMRLEAQMLFSPFMLQISNYNKSKLNS